MNEHWMKDIQERFADFEKPAPEGLLADVQQEMLRRGLLPVEQKKERIIPLWVRGLAVAASLTVVLGVGALLLMDRNDEVNGIEGLTESMQTLQNIQKEAEVKAESTAQIVSTTPIGQDAPISSVASEKLVAPSSTVVGSDTKQELVAQVVSVEKQDGADWLNSPVGQNETNRIDEQVKNAEAEGQVSSDDINPTSDQELALTQPTQNSQQSMGNGHFLQQQEPTGSPGWPSRDKIGRSQRSTVSNWQVGVNASGLRGMGSPSYSYLTYNNMLSKSDKEFFQATVNKKPNMNPEITEHNHGHGVVAGGIEGVDTNAGQPIMDDPTPGNQQQPITDLPNESPVYYSPNFAYTRFQNNSMTIVNNQPAQVHMTAHHRQPVKVGVSLRYQFNDRWGVQTGIDYSYHSSDLISQIDNSQIQSEQKLHFIGLPVAFSYSLWSPGKFNFYLSAGGEVEKVIKGSRTNLKLAPDMLDQVEKEDVEEKPWQISVVGSGGIQFNINHLLSLYAEPGVAYYFNNHSSLPTIYQEKPFNLNLSFGLRFNLNSK